MLGYVTRAYDRHPGPFRRHENTPDTFLISPWVTPVALALGFHRQGTYHRHGDVTRRIRTSRALSRQFTAPLRSLGGGVIGAYFQGSSSRDALKVRNNHPPPLGGGSEATQGSPNGATFSALVSSDEFGRAWKGHGEESPPHFGGI